MIWWPSRAMATDRMSPEDEPTRAPVSDGDRPLIVRVWDAEMAERVAAAAGRLGVAVTLLSAPAAATHGGIGWFAELVARVAARRPAPPVSWILDCGDRAGAAVAAIEAGCPAIVLTLQGESAERVARLATARGVSVLTDAPPALIPRPGGDMVRACRDWIRALGVEILPESRASAPSDVAKS